MDAARGPLVLYVREGCHLCEDAKHAIERVGSRFSNLPMTVLVTNVDYDEALRAQYGTEIPVVLINGVEAFRHRVDETELERKLTQLWNKSTS